MKLGFMPQVLILALVAMMQMVIECATRWMFLQDLMTPLTEIVMVSQTIVTYVISIGQ